MAVDILFFGLTAVVTGKKRVEIEVVGDVVASDIFEKIIAKFPQLKSHRLLFSVNQQYATGEEVLKDGDELAVFTAVSGG